MLLLPLWRSFGGATATLPAARAVILERSEGFGGLVSEWCVLSR